MLKPLKKIYHLLNRRERIKFLLLFGMMLFAAFLEVLGIGMIPAFIVTVSDPEFIFSYPFVGQVLEKLNIKTQESLVLFGAVLLMAIYIGKNIYMGFFFYFKKKFILNRGVDLQYRLFRAYMGAPYTFYISRNSSELLRNMTAEVKGIVERVMLPFMELLLNVVMALLIISLLLVAEPLISLVTLIMLGGTGYFFLSITRSKISSFGKEDRHLRKMMNISFLQGLGGFKDARILGRETMFLDEYKQFAVRRKVANVYLYVVKKLPKPITETLAVLTILIITLILIWQGRSISSIIPILGLFGAAAVKLMPMINVMISNISEIRYNTPSVSAVDYDLRLLEGNTYKFKSKNRENHQILPLQDIISIQNVSYCYPNTDDYAVKDASLQIRCGEAVAFVGESGAGKTTMADIILGLLEPQEGSVFVDGRKIQENMRGWQKNIGYVPQSIFLLDDTIRRNIAFGIPENEIDEEKMKKAVEASQLKDLIERLPDGEETIVGERGVRFSGGQRQRIGIARALYNNPQVLIMDEATSALDNVTEKYVIEAIDQLKGNLTIIMIAHRLTTVINCDRLYMMENGKIIAEGSYESLLKSSARFCKMALKS